MSTATTRTPNSTRFDCNVSWTEVPKVDAQHLLMLANDTQFQRRAHCWVDLQMMLDTSRVQSCTEAFRCAVLTDDLRQKARPRAQRHDVSGYIGCAAGAFIAS